MSLRGVSHFPNGLPKLVCKHPVTLEEARSQICQVKTNIPAITDAEFGDLIQDLNNERLDLEKWCVSPVDDPSLQPPIDKLGGLALRIRAVLADIILATKLLHPKISTGADACAHVRDEIQNQCAHIDGVSFRVFLIISSYTTNIAQHVVARAKIMHYTGTREVSCPLADKIYPREVMANLLGWTRIMRDNLLVLWDQIEANKDGLRPHEPRDGP